MHHVHVLPGGEEDVKLIGVYSSRAKARAAVRRVRGAPGFRDHPRGFTVEAMTVDRDHWVEGFATMVANSEPSSDATIPNSGGEKR